MLLLPVGCKQGETYSVSGADDSHSNHRCGRYLYLTVTGPDGCTANDAAVVTLNSVAPDANAGPDKSVTCAVDPVVLTGSSSTEGAIFAWTATNGGHIVSGANTSSLTVDASGTYTLEVTDPSNGCSAIDDAIVTLEKDTEPPVIVCPAAITVSCASAVPDPVLPSATDDCGMDKVEWTGDVLTDQTCENRFSIKRTFKATDVNGNSAECVQIITVSDNTAPILTLPADYNGFRGANCAYDTRPATTGQATASDNCDKSVEVSYTDDFNLMTECKKIITRTWKATDKCGNVATGIQTLTYIDDTDPVLVIPADYNGFRGPGGEFDTRTVTTGQATATDNCDQSVEVTYTDVFVLKTTCKKIITRTWKAVDNCGNFATGTQTLTYIDNTAPVLVVPADYNGLRGVRGAYDTRPAITGQATAIDNCDESVVVTYTDAFVLMTECKKIITRTWKAADRCGNTSTGTQTLTYIDGTGPVLKIPADYNGFRGETVNLIQILQLQDRQQQLITSMNRSKLPIRMPSSLQHHAGRLLTEHGKRLTTAGTVQLVFRLSNSLMKPIRLSFWTITKLITQLKDVICNSDFPNLWYLITVPVM